MRLFKLTSNKIDSVQAITKVSKYDKDKLYFNIPHGNKGKGLYCYYIPIDVRVARPTDRSDLLTMSGDDYFLKPLRSKTNSKQVLKDGIGNDLYFIGKDMSYKGDNEILLFWNIPFTGYSNVTYEVEGQANIIATARSGKERGEGVISSPSPIIEIYGNCKLTWTAKRKSDNTIVEQTIEYDIITDNFSINPIKVKED